MDELKDFATNLGRQAEQFAQTVEKEVSAKVSKGVLSFSGDLKEGFNVELSYNKEKLFLVLQPVIPIQGWQVDSHKYFVRKASVERLKQWILNIGVNSFDYVPGYEQNELPTDDEAAQRIAWAMKMSNKKERFIKTPREAQVVIFPYYSERATFRDAITNEFFDTISDKVLNSIARQLSGNKKSRAA